MKRSILSFAILVICSVAFADEPSAKELLDAARAQYNARRYADALATYEKARAAGDASGDAITAAYAKLGIAAVRTMRNEFESGIAIGEEARATFEAAGHRRGLADANRHIGNLYMGRGHFEAAGERFQKCADVADRDTERAVCLERLGETETSLGRPRQAMATLRRAIDLAVASNNRPVHASALGAISDVHLDQGNGDLAVYYGEKSVAMFRELGSQIGTSVRLNNLAEAYVLAGRSDRAIETYRDNLALMERLHYTRGIIISKVNIATVLAKLGRYDEATAIIEATLPMLDGFEDPDTSANVFYVMAWLRERRGDHAGALELALKSGGQPGDRWKDLYLSAGLIGHLYRKLGRNDEAGAALGRAIELLEAAHDDLSGDEPRFFGGERSLIYADMSALRIDEGRVADALAWAERYRSRVLVDLLRSAPSDRVLSDEERARDAELRERISSLQREAFHGASAELQEKLTQASREYDAFQHDLADAHPRLQVQRGTLQPVSVRDVASRLDRDAVLIDYLVAEDKTYVFVIAGGSIEVRTIDVTQEDLARQAESFRELLAQRRPDFRKAARTLHETLIAPIAALVANRKTWILVPDGPLWNLPFQALVDARGKYVAEQTAIVYAPSISAWMEMSRPRAETSDGPRRELLAFGNPFAPAGLGAEHMRGNLAPLPEAETEVRGAARFYGPESSVYLRGEATEERFKREASRYRVLHIAGHGVLNDVSPMHSYVLLAARNGGAEDGYLEARELMQMDLGADLVVLSACETARGKYAAGEGIIGLSWALFAARCRTQVVSQWKVNSAATSVLMRLFHQNVSADRHKAASAMQKSIAAMLKTKEYRHPFYWAGFVVLGDAR